MNSNDLPMTAPPPLSKKSAAIDVRSLRVDYGSFTAVDDLTLTVPAGEVFGLVGPNGAGKTSTFRVLTTLMEPTYGEVRLDGVDVFEEVEAALGSHPAVLMSAVVGIPHPEWGEAVHAEVMLRPGCSATPEELIAHVKGRIGGYKAPKSVTLVRELPVSTVGKVNRRQVKQKYWQGLERRVS